ncbi:MAG TPA: 8-amino-7-oxononanoate synthase [Pirellulaceae bacterium]|jgi:8-amino-7-oxononanoate synthase|nr:8-amino-7-oxononanoate synthase [Pirellulaceae bacterium]
MNYDPFGWIGAALAERDRAGLLRELRVRQRALPDGTMTLGGLPFVNFSSNDYLGLAADPRLAEAAASAAVADAWGAGASPLVTGRTELHARLESALAAFEGADAALLFTSGYAANVGTVTSLAGRGDCIFSDARNHASLIDGCRLSGANVRVYAHADLDELANALSEAPRDGRRLIVTDSVFSMDGDAAPLAEIARLAERHGAMLLVDEAHATGVFGERGSGLCEAAGLTAGRYSPSWRISTSPGSEQALRGSRKHGDAAPSSRHTCRESRPVERIDAPLSGFPLAKVGTLSKALGSHGAFVAGPKSVVELVAQKARSYVFSTAAPAALAAAGLRALELVQEEPQRRARVLELARRVRESLREQGWNCGAGSTQIVPVFVGEPGAAVELSTALAERGMWVPAIRPPSVPPGESLLRISLSAAHSDEQIERLLGAFRESREFRSR